MGLLARALLQKIGLLEQIELTPTGLLGQILLPKLVYLDEN